MAAKSVATRAVASFGKRSVSQGFAPAPAVSAFRKNVHTSVYDKNIDEHVRPAVVPDNVIRHEAEKYWAPHPHTGVFGPFADAGPGGSHERGFHSSPRKATGGLESVLEEKAFFRPLENLEKPQHP